MKHPERDFETFAAYRCVVATSASDLDSHLPAWDELERRALEDNFYFSGPVLRAAMRQDSGRHYIVLVYHTSGRARRLTGVAAFTLVPPSPAVPARVLSTFTSPHPYLAHPVLDRDAAAATLRAIWDWVEEPRHPWTLVRLHNVRRQGATWTLIREELARRGRRHWVKSAFRRASLTRSGSYDHFLASLSQRRRKATRRGWNQEVLAGHPCRAGDRAGIP